MKTHPRKGTKLWAVTKEYLVSEYVDKQRDIKDLAVENETSYRSMWQKIKRCGILVRKANRRSNHHGKVFGKLTVIGFAGVKNGSSRWKCRCECGNIIVAKACNLNRENRRSCGCDVGFSRGSNHKLWCGHGEISGSAWSKIKEAAKIRGFEVKISIEDAWLLFLKQDKKCSITHVPLVFAPDAKSHTRGGTTASLDRIDSVRGYVKGNVQWVHKIINRMKWNLPAEDFYKWCALVTEGSKKSRIIT